ncbi:hypothetical protein [Mesorhizobium sp.]|uniref:hypothetical protein n=1 Tax=Mesorhizobium sp. TaxID=1871066 RepID=UPI003BADA88B
MTQESLLVVTSIVTVFVLFIAVLAYVTFQESRQQPRRQRAASIETNRTPGRRAA